MCGSSPAVVPRLRTQALSRVTRVGDLHRPSRCSQRKWVLQKQFAPGAASTRFASSHSQPPPSTASLSYKRFKNVLSGTALAFFFCCGYMYVTDVRAGIHQWGIAPSLRWIYDDAEEAHEAGTESLKSLYAWGLHPRERGNGDQRGDLNVEVFTILCLNQWTTFSSENL